MNLLSAVVECGKECAPRGLKIKELLATQLIVRDLRRNVLVHPDRDLNYRFMVAEWLWIRDGREDVAWIERYNKQIARFSDDGVIFNGAYGPRLARQWDYLLETLRRDPDSRQAVATIWTPSPGKSKDVPCTMALQLFLRDGQLHGIVTMRSNDLWLGTPYDFFNFSQVVNGLAGDLGVEPGSFTLQAGSSHVYESNFEAAEKVLSNHSQGWTLSSPRLPSSPPSGITRYRFSEEKHPTWAEYQLALSVPTKAAAFEVLRGLGEAS